MFCFSGGCNVFIGFGESAEHGGRCPNDPCQHENCPHGCIPCGDCKSILFCGTEPLISQ